MRRRQALLANPFVVVSDMTIALAFFFAVYSLTSVLAYSKALEAAERDRHQQETLKDLLATLQSHFENSRVDSSIAHSYRLYRGQDQVAAVQDNGNYQRVSIYQSVSLLTPNSGIARDVGPFRPDATGLKGDDYVLYVDLAQTIKRHAARLSYLYVHGITEKQECPDNAVAVARSRARSDFVMGILGSDNIRLLGKATDNRPDEEIYAGGLMPLKYVIPFGTGSELYATGGASGRVDFVLFHSEKKRTEGKSK